jgi:hypothetical protein
MGGPKDAWQNLSKIGKNPMSNPSAEALRWAERILPIWNIIPHLIGCKLRPGIFSLVPKFRLRTGFFIKLMINSMHFNGKLNTCPENQNGRHRYLDNYMQE